MKERVRVKEEREKGGVEKSNIMDLIIHLLDIVDNLCFMSSPMALSCDGKKHTKKYIS